MFTSDRDNNWTGLARISLTYLLASLFCALFGAVYEIFSHEVYSYFMLYAFVFPLTFGTLPFLVLSLSRIRQPDTVSRCLYHSGISAWTVGSLFQGALEIYGTGNKLTIVYWIVGGIFVLTGAVRYFVGGRGFSGRGACCQEGNQSI